MQSLVRQQLNRAQHKMKNQANRHRTPRSFQPGDSVYLKAQPYVQTSLAPRSSNKLAFRFFGPFLITEKIGPSAYRLQLPPDCLIHPVFYVSQLKKVIPSAALASPELPNISNQLQVPQAILDRRLRQHNDRVIPQVLVRWSYLPNTLSTWEDEESLHQQFPRAPAWGQAGSKGGRDVTGDPDISEPDDGKTRDASPEEPAGRNKEVKRVKKPSNKVFGPDWTI